MTCLTPKAFTVLSPFSYSQHKDDRIVEHRSLKLQTLQPVTGDDECQVHGSSTYIIKPWFDLAQGNTSHFHSTEMNQEVILSAMAAHCGGSRRSRGSCFTNGCLHNSLSANRMQISHALCACCSSHMWLNCLTFLAETYLSTDF